MRGPVSGLTRGPVHRAAAQKMQVDVKHRLSGPFIGVEERPISDLGKAAFLRDERRPADELADDLIVFGSDVVERRNMTLRHDQNVCRRLRVDVAEREHAVVFVDDGRRDLARRDPAEETIGSHDGIVAVNVEREKSKVRR